MRLMIEMHAAEIKKYEHIQPAPTFGPLRCNAMFPGQPRSCTRESGHEGPHVAHAFPDTVVAVWDE